MGESRAIAGCLDNRGALRILELGVVQLWTGELLLKQGDSASRVWLVKGEVVHATLRGTESWIGLPALEISMAWTWGEYILHAGVLPPDRSIRLPARHLLESLRDIEDRTQSLSVHQRSGVVGTTLVQVFNGLRERVPGLKSLSVMRGQEFEATTTNDEDEISWMDRQLKFFFAHDHDEPETMFLQEGGHALLVMKNGAMSTILSARVGTAPEALFWAGTEAQKRVTMSDEITPSSR